MNIFAAGGSFLAQNAFKFLGNKNLLGSADELVVLFAQNAISAQIKCRLGSAEVTAYRAKQADRIRKPIMRFLEKHAVKYRDLWVAGAYD